MLRRLILCHRALAVLICAVALAVKLLVPAGYMIGDAGGRTVMILCPGAAMPAAAAAAAAATATATPMDHGGMATHAAGDDAGKAHGMAEPPCAFAGLAAPALAAADPLLLAIAIAYGLAVALRPVRVASRAAAPHLRPPLRGPPAFS